jgi:hypothetical protein
MASICQNETGKNTNGHCLLPVSHRRMIKRIPTVTPHDSFVIVPKASLVMTSIHPYLPIMALDRHHAITAPPNIHATISNMLAKCVAAVRVKHWYLMTASYRQLSSGVACYQLVTNKAYYGNRQCVQPLFTHPTDYTDLKGETTKGMCDRPI